MRNIAGQGREVDRDAIGRSWPTLGMALGANLFSKHAPPLPRFQGIFLLTSTAPMPQIEPAVDSSPKSSCV
jgi:hypothetical protein